MAESEQDISSFTLQTLQHYTNVSIVSSPGKNSLNDASESDNHLKEDKNPFEIHTEREDYLYESAQGRTPSSPYIIREADEEQESSQS